ncbi:hypothetical protein SADUNF_Sadunf04G0088400 [Salix dunnii]|uniref:Uncharacterized protein n=1 Tax=Salix dunnii TaxID=1413687 RepID=A0A835N2T9_9ROSI|nr:hypothetical protein SADUNF_Sadunf04G0088400 [Salix dunnii]
MDQLHNHYVWHNGLLNYKGQIVVPVDSTLHVKLHQDWQPLMCIVHLQKIRITILLAKDALHQELYGVPENLVQDIGTYRSPPTTTYYLPSMGGHHNRFNYEITHLTGQRYHHGSCS